MVPFDSSFWEVTNLPSCENARCLIVRVFVVHFTVHFFKLVKNKRCIQSKVLVQVCVNRSNLLRRLLCLLACALLTGSSLREIFFHAFCLGIGTC